MTVLRVIQEVPYDEGIDAVNVELQTGYERAVCVPERHKGCAPLKLGPMGIQRCPVCIGEIAECCC